MNTLIRVLSGQHRALERKVGLLNDALGRGSATEVQAMLPAFKISMVAHLKLEDSDLYPELLRTAEAVQDPQLALVARAFARTMPPISAGLIDFIQRHETRKLDLEVFARDWSKLLGLLTSRIQSEESTLYPLYAKAVLRQSPPGAAQLSPGRA
jgi:hypothetical protein